MDVAYWLLSPKPTNLYIRFSAIWQEAGISGTGNGHACIVLKDKGSGIGGGRERGFRKYPLSTCVPRELLRSVQGTCRYMGTEYQANAWVQTLPKAPSFSSKLFHRQVR